MSDLINKSLGPCSECGVPTPVKETGWTCLRCKVVEAAEACVHGWEEQMPDGEHVTIYPFTDYANEKLHAAVVALQEARDE